MIEFNSIETITDFIEKCKRESKSIGFVPTMGALHKGHYSLIERAKNDNDIVICSIYINDFQFNQREDFDNYPKTLDEDKFGLKQVSCDVLFLPTKENLFSASIESEYFLGGLDLTMEGHYRPGHFNGVAKVVERFLEIIKPDNAYFGEKDYQQLAVIKYLAKEKNISTNIIGVNTKRESSGLAMSSRNLRLSEEDKIKASTIYKTLLFAKNNVGILSPNQIVEKAKELLKLNFRIDYFLIVDENSLQPISSWSTAKAPRAFVAVFLSNVRLIDNISLID